MILESGLKYLNRNHCVLFLEYVDEKYCLVKDLVDESIRTVRRKEIYPLCPVNIV